MTETNITGGQKPWDLVRRGNVDEGLALMREGYARDPSPSHVMRLGVGYLWAKEYDAAWEHFEHAIERHPQSIAVFFGMAGAAKWCVGEPWAAVRVWESGLNSQYADGAGGVHLPLLLLVASTLRPASFSRSDALKILSKKAKDVRVNNWPGPIARYVLNLIDEGTLERQSIDGSNREASSRKWLALFYKRILDLGIGTLNPQEFKELMRRMADTSEPDWSDEKEFLRLLWNEEFFVARHEASVL
jgi:lipoprotein NlpI